MIRQLVKTVVGQFGSNQTEPVCVASDRDDQKLGEMMTIVMRYAYSLNKMWGGRPAYIRELRHIWNSRP